MGLFHAFPGSVAFARRAKEMSNIMCRILWVDDQIDGLGPYIRALENEGFEVVAADSGSAAMEQAKVGDFDIVLSDIWMAPQDGIDLLKQIRPIQPSARYAVLSSYLYLERFREELRAVQFPVQVIDKDMPATSAVDFKERFIDPIVSLRENGVTQTLADQELALLEGDEPNPFKISLSDFMKKPIVEKDRLAMKAGILAQDLLKREFRNGKTWVMLCGSSQAVAASANTTEEILSEEKIMEYARVQRSAPYHFFRPVSVEDMEWSNCTSGEQTVNYPTVTISFKEHGPRNVHFDTGAPFSFFSYEELLKMEVLSPTSIGFARSWRGETDYWALNLNVEVLLKCQVNHQTKIVRLQGQAVRDWVDGPFKRLCSPSCSNRLPDRVLCEGRVVGLVGRNLLTDNRLAVVLDGNIRKTRIS